MKVLLIDSRKRIIRKKSNNNSSYSVMKRHDIITKEEYDICLSIFKKELSGFKLFKNNIEYDNSAYDQYANDKEMYDEFTFAYVSWENNELFDDSEFGEKVRKAKGYTADFNEFYGECESDADKLSDKVNSKIKEKYKGINFICQISGDDGFMFQFESKKSKES